MIPGSPVRIRKTQKVDVKNPKNIAYGMEIGDEISINLYTLYIFLYLIGASRDDSIYYDNQERKRHYSANYVQPKCSGNGSSGRKK